MNAEGNKSPNEPLVALRHWRRSVAKGSAMSGALGDAGRERQR